MIFLGYWGMVHAFQLVLDRELHHFIDSFFVARMYQEEGSKHHQHSKGTTDVSSKAHDQGIHQIAAYATPEQSLEFSDAALLLQIFDVLEIRRFEMGLGVGLHSFVVDVSSRRVVANSLVPVEPAFHYYS